MDHVTDNLPPPTNSLFLLKIGDMFKVNWTHSDLSNLCPLRGDSKLILITIDLQTMALLLLWLHSCHYTGFMVQDAERPGNLWEVPGALPLGDPYPGLVSPLVRTWCSGHAGSQHEASKEPLSAVVGGSCEALFLLLVLGVTNLVSFYLDTLSETLTHYPSESWQEPCPILCLIFLD